MCQLRSICLAGEFNRQSVMVIETRDFDNWKVPLVNRNPPIYVQLRIIHVTFVPPKQGRYCRDLDWSEVSNIMFNNVQAYLEFPQRTNYREPMDFPNDWVFL